MAFLERVKELKEARHVGEVELFSSAIDLFTGPALLWYRNIKHHVNSWNELVKCLKREFLPVDYEEDLKAEIRARTQGINENVLFYIIAVEALFNRLSSPPDEIEIIKQLCRNLNPYFSEKLVLSEIKSLEDFKDKCRTIQELKVRTSRYHPPPSRKQQLLEPDLACLTLSDESTMTSVPVSGTCFAVSSVTCWNCLQSGHTHRQCTSPKTIFCYACGTTGEYSSSCFNCKSKNADSGAGSSLNVQDGAAPKKNSINTPHEIFPPSTPSTLDQKQPTVTRQVRFTSTQNSKKPEINLSKTQ
jgi:Retrotransposon gag protein